MKHIILTCIIAAIFSQSQSQVIKFKAKEFAITAMGSKEIKPRIWLDTDVLVVLNLNKDMLTIYSKEERSFDIIKYGKTDTTVNCRAYNYSCIDKDGEKCRLTVIMWDENVENKYKVSLVVESPKESFAYNMVSEAVN